LVQRHCPRDILAGTLASQVLPTAGPSFALRVSKADRMAKWIDMLTVLHCETSNSFFCIMTDDESCFLRKSPWSYISNETIWSDCRRKWHNRGSKSL
jgi:hypothetical protein